MEAEVQSTDCCRSLLAYGIMHNLTIIDVLGAHRTHCKLVTDYMHQQTGVLPNDLLHVYTAYIFTHNRLWPTWLQNTTHSLWQNLC